jgi:hypothetical protein
LTPASESRLTIPYPGNVIFIFYKLSQFFEQIRRPQHAPTADIAQCSRESYFGDSTAKKFAVGNLFSVLKFALS